MYTYGIKANRLYFVQTNFFRYSDNDLYLIQQAFSDKTFMNKS